VSYIYDVFISYAQTEPSKGWVRSYFVPVLREYLAVELPDECRVFLDGDDLRPGGTQTEELKRNLHRSRVMVPVFSTAYFRSKWCNAELECLMEREALLGRRTTQTPKGLIFPVKLFDGKFYPKRVSNITFADFSAFAHAAADSPFRSSPSYLDFRTRVREFVLDLSETLLNPPPWEERFPVMKEPTAFEDAAPELIPQPKMF
jgi:hypothetical protein